MNAPVSLTQIPYTGFDFGALGDALFFLAIALFAACGAYLILYWRGGAFAFWSDVKQQFWG